MKKCELLKNQVIKNILSAIAVGVFGFMLLTLAFLFDFLFQSVINIFLRLFIPADLDMGTVWFPPLKHALFAVLICLISWAVFKSKLGTIYKAIYMTVPVAVILATIGILLYHMPVAVYSLGSLFCVGVLYYFYRTKQSWLYYYTVVLVSLTMAIFTLLGGEI